MMLDRLLGPFWEIAGALMPKRVTFRILSGATAVDNASGEGSTDITITGDGNATSIKGKVISTLHEFTGWMLSYNASTGEFDSVRGLQVIQTGEVTIAGASSKSINCTSLAAGDLILYTLKTVGGTPGTPHELTRTDGEGFTVNGAASNSSTYYYAIVRLAAAAPA
jgi:hypothetical protein